MPARGINELLRIRSVEQKCEGKCRKHPHEWMNQFSKAPPSGNSESQMRLEEMAEKKRRVWNECMSECRKQHGIDNKKYLSHTSATAAVKEKHKEEEEEAQLREAEDDEMFELAWHNHTQGRSCFGRLCGLSKRNFRNEWNKSRAWRRKTRGGGRKHKRNRRTRRH